MKFRLQNVRCFSDTGVVRIAPLTLLVGENSTGKTSFMAMFRMALQMLSSREPPDFNAPPFLLGAYDQIAHNHGGRSGRAKEFSVHLGVKTRARVKDGSQAYNIDWRFIKEGSQPYLHDTRVLSDKYNIRIDKEKNKPRMVILDKSEDTILSEVIEFTDDYVQLRDHLHLISRLRFLAFSKDANERKLDEIAESFKPLLFNQFPSPYPFAPIRSHPRRIYDPVKDTPSPGGEHVPMRMAKLRFAKGERWQQIKKAIDDFGAASGMFKAIEIKSHGRSDSDPFQIAVKVSGATSNLIDVGYGVSQVLPILFDLIEEQKSNRHYLLQQPEVHLHPRGQAALGSFLAAFASKDGRVMIETHSDYIIDRICTDARDKLIKPEDVSMLYFERKGQNVDIHQLHLDGEGNILGAPPSYRDFFMLEQRRILGV